jgi:hypothetical protein
MTERSQQRIDSSVTVVQSVCLTLAKSGVRTKDNRWLVLSRQSTQRRTRARIAQMVSASLRLHTSRRCLSTARMTTWLGKREDDVTFFAKVVIFDVSLRYRRLPSRHNTRRRNAGREGSCDGQLCPALAPMESFSAIFSSLSPQCFTCGRQVSLCRYSKSSSNTFACGETWPRQTSRRRSRYPLFTAANSCREGTALRDQPRTDC